MAKVYIDKKQTEIARANSQTGDIIVSERFDKLDKKIREFVLLSFTELMRHKNAPYDSSARVKADLYAIDILLNKYPEIPLSYYIREITALFAHEQAINHNWRLARLKEYKPKP